jgi:hypothetical protein
MSSIARLRSIAARAFRRRLSLGVLVAATSLCAFVTAYGQAGRDGLIGRVRDLDGRPVAGADVSIATLRLLLQTDSAGSFAFTKVKAGTHRLMVRRLGYIPASVDVTVGDAPRDTLSLEMARNPQVLPGVTTADASYRRLLDIEEFYRRRARNSGPFFTRAEIEARNSARLSDVLRNMPGFQIVRLPGTQRLGIRSTNASLTGRGCAPLVFVDGVRLHGSEIDDLSTRDVEGIEVYRGVATTPAQFVQGTDTPCGAIAIWSRVPGGR